MYTVKLYIKTKLSCVISCNTYCYNYTMLCYMLHAIPPLSSPPLSPLPSPPLPSPPQVINAYLEAYHHVISRPDRARLGGVVTTLLKTRPLQHPGAAYFTHSYQAEGRGLACHLQLVEALSRSQLTRERENNMTLHGEGHMTSHDIT